MSKENMEEKKHHCHDCENHEVEHECDCEEHECDCEECDCEECDSELEQRVMELEDKLLRTQADLINYRKRKDEEMARFVKYANEGLVLEILPLLDNFERALLMNSENVSEDVSKFLTGFKMIHDNFSKTLEKFSVKEINGINKPFDPIYHEAVLKEAKEGVESGMVIQILQKGYLLNDKVIRPAMVKVSE